MLAWYCCIGDVNNILEKVKISKTNFGGLLLFNLFFILCSCSYYLNSDHLVPALSQSYLLSKT